MYIYVHDHPFCCNIYMYILTQAVAVSIITIRPGTCTVTLRALKLWLYSKWHCWKASWVFEGAIHYPAITSTHTLKLYFVDVSWIDIMCEVSNDSCIGVHFQANCCQAGEMHIKHLLHFWDTSITPNDLKDVVSNVLYVLICWQGALLL